MAQSRQYVDAAGVAVNWSTAVVSGVAQVDIYEVITEDQHSNRYTFAKAGQPVDPGKLAAAQYADSTVGTRALTGILTQALEVARPDGAAVRYLPVGAAAGTVRAVQNTGTAPIRVAPAGTDTIDGGTATVVVQPGEVARFQSNGSGAWVHVVDLTKDALLSGIYVQRAGGTSTTTAPLAYFNVRDYGAVGNGTTDDTAAFQAAINAAMAVGGKLLIPASSNPYIIGNTLNIAPASGTQVVLDIEGQGNFSQILFTGTGIPVFHSLGWKRSKVERVSVRVAASKTDVVVWDVDCNSTYATSGELTFDNCQITVADSTVTGLVAWRLGHASTGQDISFVTFSTCTVAAATTGQAKANIGWSIEGNNTLHISWYNCAGSYLDKVFTNVATAGAAGPQGANSYFFTDCGGSYNVLLYELKTAGVYKINGGRWELCQQLLSIPSGGASTNYTTITISNLQMAAFSLLNNRLVDAGAAASIIFEACNLGLVNGQTPTSSIFRLATGSGGYGSLHIRGIGLPASTPDPFYTVASGNWSVDIRGAFTLNSSGQSTAQLTDRGSSSGSDIQVFTANGTWVKPSGAKTVRTLVWGAGGGGGSGRRGAATTVRCGGGGGASGGFTDHTVDASLLGATESVTVAAGGASGAAVTTDDTNGNAGGNAGATYLGGGPTTYAIWANGGNGGAGGTASTGTGGSGGSGGTVTGLSGGSASASGGTGTGGSSGVGAAGSGASGGGITSGDGVGAGGTGGNGVNRVAGGVAGSGGSAGGAGTALGSAAWYGGGGGGGGAASITAAAGSGGVGALYGSGGGGGGASLNGNSSGAGGNGAGGLVVVITSF